MEKSLVSNANKESKVKVSLNKNGTIQFEPHENINLFKKLFSKLATNLVKKLPVSSNKLISGTTKIIILVYLTTTEKNFPKILLKEICLG